MVGIVHSGGVGGGTLVYSRGSFQLLSIGSLQLVDGSGAILWNSGTSHFGVFSTFLDEQGNFVLTMEHEIVLTSFLLEVTGKGWASTLLD